MPALNFGLQALKHAAKTYMCKQIKSSAAGDGKCKRHKNIWTLELQLLQSEYGQLHAEFRKRGLRRAINKDLLHDGSFHKAIAPVLVLAQCFCIMPLHGVYGKSIRALQFRWKSGRFVYCLVYVATTFVSTILVIHMLVHSELDARNFIPLIFHGFLLVSLVYFLYLAGKWPRLMQQWAQVEQQLPPHECFEQRERMPRRIKKVSCIFFLLALTEHLLSTITAIHFANYCPSRPDPIESYFADVSVHIFSMFEYNIWLGLIGKLQNIYMTFGWSYTDIFLMTIGIGLSELFVRLQQRIERAQGKRMPECYWVHTRRQYRMICDLIAKLDGLLSGIVMLSFANNMYFVCIQCLQSLNKMPSVAHAVYFYFSLVFLLSRMLAVALFLAEVNEHARQPLHIVQRVPTEVYYVEVQRFADELTNDMVALTGMKFFTITRKLVLTVAGTIVTYELVLIQFYENRSLWQCSRNGTD